MVRSQESSLHDLKNSDLAAECQETDWRAREHAVEGGSRGFVSKATVQLLHSAGLEGSSLQNAIKELGEEARRRATG